MTRHFTRYVSAPSPHSNPCRLGTLPLPPGFLPDADTVKQCQSTGVSAISVSHDPMEAVKGADIIYTDVWASMGQKEEAEARKRSFQGFQVGGWGGTSSLVAAFLM